MTEAKRKAHAEFQDLIGDEAILTDTMIGFLVGRKVEISGSIESGGFKTTSLIHGVEFTKKMVHCIENVSSSTISDVKIMVDGINGKPLDLSCVDVLTIIEKKTPDDEKIISYIFNVKADKNGVRLYRVYESGEIEFEVSEKEKAEKER